MQHAGKTSEIGHSCFAMNIKGGRGFPGISLHDPIKWSRCLILITSKTNGKQLGRGHCVLVEWGSAEWGWLSAIVWENVRLREIERWLSRRKNRVKVNEWFLHWRQRSHCDSNWVSQKQIYHLFDTNCFAGFLCLLHWQPGYKHRTSAPSFISVVQFFFLSSDKMKLDSFLPSPWPPLSLSVWLASCWG